MKLKAQESYRQFKRKVRRKSSRSVSLLELVGNGPLCSLPPEILYLIAKYLPPSSIAVLSLCSKALCYKLGAKFQKSDIRNSMESCAHKYPPLQYFLKIYWTYHENFMHPAISPTLPEICMFLYLLSRDSTSHIFCFRCKRQHPPEKSDWVTPWRPWSWGNCESLDGHYLRYYYGRYFHFERAQLAMQKYRKGLSPKKELKRLTNLSSIPNSSSGMWPDMRTLRCLEAKIISNRFYLKAVRKRINLNEKCKTMLEKIHRRTYICPHLIEIECVVRNIVDGCLIHDGRNMYRRIVSLPLAQCKYCRTEMQFEVFESKKFASSYRSIVVTTWQDFGTLNHPYDPDWVAHLATENPYIPISYPFGSIRKLFETTLPEG